MMALHRLAGRAFRLTPGQSESFRHSSYARALEAVMAAAQQQEGLIIVTGPPGTGKTTLAGDLAARFRASGARVGRLLNALVSGDDLLRLTSYAFGLGADALTKADLLIALASELAGARAGHARAVLIVDEAQDLQPSALEELRLLCNLAAELGPSMQILLVGQDGLWDLLQRPEHAHIHQIVIASCRLRPFAPPETRAYVGHNLKGAGWTGEPRVSGEALALIHRYTGGIPRLINLVMGRLLVHAGLADLRHLEVHDAECVLLELQRENLAIQLDAPADDSAVSSDMALEPLGPGYQPDPGGAEFAQTLVADNQSGRSLSALIGRHRRLSTAAVGAGLVLALAGISSWLASLDLGSVTAPATASVQRTQTVTGELADNGEGLDSALVAAAANPFVASGPDPTNSPAEAALTQTHGAAPDGAATDQPSTEDDAVHTPGPSTPNAAGAAEPDRMASGVDRLLARGKQALAENRLTLPKGNSAYDHYRAVLARDPHNAQAKQGLHQIVLAYGALARSRLSQDDLDDARRFAERGLRIDRRDPTLRSILTRIAERQRRPEDPAAMLVRRFTEWLHSADNEKSFFLSD